MLELPFILLLCKIKKHLNISTKVTQAPLTIDPYDTESTQISNCPLLSKLNSRIVTGVTSRQSIHLWQKIINASQQARHPNSKGTPQ